ncbi:MAG: hypothetical protein Q9165_005095 [Trypethelium subeluteriae]
MTTANPPPEGTIPFKVKILDRDGHIWYRILGGLDSDVIPLIIIAGGPGACHEYMIPFVDLQTQYNIPVILYDAIGNGKSTHLRDKDGDESFWTMSLFINELENLIEYLGIRSRGTRKYHVYGHSFGGMLLANYAATNPEGLERIIIAAAPASAELHRQGLLTLKATLPKDIQDTIDRCEREGKQDSKEYEEACMQFYKKYLCRLEPWPKEVETALWHFSDDPTVYGTMYVVTSNMSMT